MMYKSGGRYTQVDYIFEESRLSELKKGMPKSTAAAQTSQLSSTGTMGYLHTKKSPQLNQGWMESTIANRMSR